MGVTELSCVVLQPCHGIETCALEDGGVATRLSHFSQPGVTFMKKTSLFSANSVAVAVAALCASMPAFAQVEAKVTGRVHFDARNIDPGNSGISLSAASSALSAADNFEIRRARIGMVGTINKDIAFEVVGNAVGSTTNFIDTAWVNYGFNKAAQIRTGRFKQPFSLEELTSSNSIDFMERSYGNQLVPGKRIGMMLHGEPTKGLVYGVSVFQNDFAEVAGNGTAGNNYAARVAVDAAQLLTKYDNMVLHAGYASTQGRADIAPTSSTSTSITALKLRSENRGLADTLKVTLGHTAGNAIRNNKKMSGFELALATGPFKFQAEHFDSKYDMAGSATQIGDIKLKANYYEFMYNVTGEAWAKSYKGGAFSSISPDQVFMKDYGGVVGNGIGAWQVGVRVSAYDASGSTVTGAGSNIKSNDTSAVTSGDLFKANTNTYAVNWILNSNARVMLNYSDTRFNTDYKVASLTTKKEQVVSLRTQINF
jgi:phosphate-selective porin OprO/OprP